MPVQSSNTKICARPDSANNLLQILIIYQLHLIVYCVKKGTLHFIYVLEDDLLGKHSVITLPPPPPQKKKKVKIENALWKLLRFSGLSKGQAGWVLAKSL